MSMTTTEALTRLEEIARENPVRYIIHLAHMNATEALCGGLVEDLVGRMKGSNTFEVVGTPASLPYWRDGRSEYCSGCAAHEDFPLFMLGAA